MSPRILVPILVLICISPALAGPPEWECHGPWGGLALRIDVDADAPDRALVTSARGPFLTSDAGRTWRPAAIPDAKRQGPMALLQGRIWSSDGEVVKSSADGVEWRSEGAVNGLPIGLGAGPGADGPVRAVVISAGPKGYLTFRLVALEDFGWATVARFSERVDPRAWPIAVIRDHPGHPGVLRVLLTSLDASDHTIVYGTDDRGRTWQRWVASPRLWDVAPLPGEGVRFAGLALHPAKPPAGLFTTEDGGRTWSAVPATPEQKRLRSIAVRPNGRLLLGTVNRHLLDTTVALEDGKVLKEGLVNESVSAVTIHPADPKRVWAGTQCGLFRSDDGGKSFAPVFAGFTAGQFTGLVPVGDRILAFEFHQGLRVSEDGARTWKPLDLEWRGRFGKVFGVVSRGETIAASTGDGAKDWRITISRDGGKTWSMRRWPDAVMATGIGPNGEVFVTQRGGSLLRVAAGVEFAAFAAGFEKLGGEVHGVRALAGGKRLLLLGAVGAATCDVADGENLTMLDPPITGRLHWPEAVLDDGNALYVTSRTKKMYRRDLPDGEWETVLTEDASRLVGMVTDPAVKGRRIAAFANGVLLVSGDGGRKWAPFAKFGSCGGVGMQPPRRLHVVADGAVRTLDLVKKAE